MKQRIFSIMMVLALCLTLLPAPVLAADATNGSLDFTNVGDGAGQTPAQGTGYEWSGDATNGYQLTLSGVTINGDLTLPTNCEITVTTSADSAITGNIWFRSNSIYSYKFDLTFNGSAALTVGGSIYQSGCDGDKITVQNGANITVNGLIYTGASGGANGTIVVSGSGSSLTVKAENQVDAPSMTIQTLQVTGGGTMTTNCTISTASVTIDKGSSVTINAGSAPAISLMNYSASAPEDEITAFTNAITPYLPTGYSVGEGTVGGYKYCTVLDRQHNIASSLTLQPEQPHSHDITVDCGSSSPATFSAWNGTDEIAFDASNTASVYLTDDVTRTEQIVIPKGHMLNLCFNGHTITYNGSADSNAIWMSDSNGTLRLCDCGSSTGTPGGITMQQGYCAVSMLYQNCSLYMYGGTLQGGSSACIRSTSGNTVEMNGGEISAASSGTYCIHSGNITINGGIFSGQPNTTIFSAGGTVTINGGTFSGSGKDIFSIGGSTEYGYATVNLNRMPEITGQYETAFRLSLEKVKINVTGKLDKPTAPLLVSFYESDNAVYANDSIPITTGWNTYMSNENPSDYFDSDIPTDAKNSDTFNARLGTDGEVVLAIPTYTITKEACDSNQGSFTISKDDVTKSKAGVTQTVYVTSGNGYLMDQVIVTGTENHQAVPVTYRKNDSPYFTMPAFPVTVKVTFKDEDLTLKSITIRDATLSPAFASNITEYTATVPAETDSVIVNAEATDDSIYALYKLTDGSGKAQLCENVKVPLNVGENILTFLGYKEPGVYKQYTVTITREAPAATDITLSPTSLSLTKGETATLTATVKPETANQAVNWTSSDESIAKVDAKGIVTATGVGTATITATTVDGSKTATCEVTVSKMTQTALTISGIPETVYPGDSFTLTATGGSGTGKITWSVSGPAEIDQNGKVKVTGTGKIVIKAVKEGDADYTQTDCSASFTAVSKPAATYPVTVADVKNGDVTVSHKSAAPGAVVTITVKPNKGYTIGNVTATDNNGKAITVTSQGNGEYTFTMPASKVTVSAKFDKIDTSYVNCPKDKTCPIWPFTDASTTAWYHDGVHYCIENSLMQGYPGSLFGPEDTSTRSMIVTILYRLEGKPAASKNPFPDVAANQWYTKAIMWAADNGIVVGYDNGKFGPNDIITREQMAAILYRYAAYKNFDVTARANLSGYADAGRISAYAKQAMAWANAEQLIIGISSTTLAPTGSTSRSQVAEIIMRFCKNITK